MLQEFKTYRAMPGSIDALMRRFRDTVLPILKRLGIDVTHCWSSPDEPDSFFYLVTFESAAAGKAAWAAFGADPEWKSAKAASESNGPLLASQSTIYLHPTDFSALPAKSKAR